ncbi:aromatic ring-hydroxylating dioxygenase subunit alpha [Mesorhizobium sp. CA8]|uniref:aromatic ring-hydroxylating oxygenase subunit alpha n=1 Tax=unclassified Mesorhizobium TaxID=325217 RepID=UPI001CCF2909|nr:MULTISPECIES: aromatic ring-hydroxylating dioxygenase subunit alpha [unclassified Mesorhizobium]MBZ9761712.1 aromatic ring-hydroxylating dioxygenase subunit alpha [Mesorhizobium sp. CA8]MBZ9820534.1 aromatic ring-hydroxylating dioxygenase subunit alpha [Mesorhizobium sp. CA4]
MDSNSFSCDLDQRDGLTFSLDARYYTDPAIFDLEKERIFFRNWQFIAHSSEIPNAGDYVTRKIIDQEIIIVRGQDDEIRAFYNVCVHRAHTLVRGDGNCGRVMTCAYHAWSYNLDGTLRGAPNHKQVEGFDRAKVRLSDVRVEIFSGFIFVNLDPDARPLRDLTGDLDKQIAAFVPNHNDLRFLVEKRIEHDCGWKVSVENFNECYHCLVVHKTLREKVLDLDTYRTAAEGIYIRHFCEGRAPGESLYRFDPEQGQNMGAFFIWPNVAIVSYPGGIVSTRHFIPINSRQTIYSYRWYTDGRANDDDILDMAQKHYDTNGVEDAAVVHEVQKGLESRGYSQGPLMIDRGLTESSEHGVGHLQRLVLQALAS